MVEMLPNGDCREALSKPRGYKTPALDGNVYLVVRCGPLWEVRCKTYSKGRLTGDQLVDVFYGERDADKYAAALATGCLE